MTKPNSRRRTARVIVVAILVGAMLTLTVGTSHAAISRPGKWLFQWDVLLNGDETRRASESWWGAATMCDRVAHVTVTAGNKSGPHWARRAAGTVASFATSALCANMLRDCARQARNSGKWAGVTLDATSLRYYCWKY